MRRFSNLKILEQGMQLVTAAHQLNDQYAHTDLAGLIKEINLLAIGIPSRIASVNEEEQEQYQQGIQQALVSVDDIHEKLADIPVKNDQLQGFETLVARESELLRNALVQKERTTFKRPLKQSRLTIASKGRAPMPLRVHQGWQAELF
jgi:hypothetical protein